eukprot:CAMPEP_0202686968 /NCGR_PEP_ID=MMETSP1385-20130828/2706_1 /ASSEMBLY_ACC=CAM_ASM_000861 /TAXON_ID=933848 /ORGANISM="Elphidium margaritaceum" /LENGTH=203 /DNA_ID=CAMNT_0049341661 /DNA_START=99 /DNA_END=710 /DNA_ORIENTATION=+
MIFPVRIKTVHGHTIILHVESNDTVERVKTQILDKEGILPEQQRLICRGHELKDDNRLSHYNINGPCVLYLAMKLGWSRSMKLPQSTAKNVFVKTLNGESISVNVGPNDTISNVKRKIWQQTGMSVDRQRLLFTGQSLLDALLISDYNIFDGCTLHIVFKNTMAMCKHSAQQQLPMASNLNECQHSCTMSSMATVQHKVEAKQ